jgi:CubicO group peptidase (beta-lactamase class C family)
MTMMRTLFVAATVFLLLPQMSMAQSAAPVRTEMETASPVAVGMSTEKLAKVVPALQEFVDDQKVAGAIVIIARHGRIVLHDRVGWSDFESGKPMEKDSILRFYSMTKAITSVAIMMLVEEGKIGLDDPVSKYVPELAGVKVFDEEVDDELKLVDAERAMTIRDLLRHTSGLTYGFFGNTPVDQAYGRASVLAGTDTLQDTIDKLGKLPLLYQPGTRFNYSVSTDVLGHVVEKVSGQQLDQFYEQRVLEPLGMHDTAFHVAAEKIDRFASNYGPRQVGGGLTVKDAASTSRYLNPPKLYSGGGGLVSTAPDYMKFCQMLLDKGEFNGTRLLKTATVESMTKNQLPDEAYPVRLGGTRPGVGFGLGFSVVVEKTEWTELCHLGEYGWGGAASTHFWISPKDDLAVVLLTQYMPFSFQLESAIKPLVYDAIIK